MGVQNQSKISLVSPEGTTAISILCIQPSLTGLLFFSYLDRGAEAPG
jgi:hypothetical protein